MSDERWNDSRSRLARRTLPTPERGRTAISLLAPASRDAHEPDAHCSGILLPGQLSSRRDAETRSVRLLMIAILRDAIDCFQKYLLDSSRRGRRLYREAETWLMAEQESSPLAFEQICDGIGLDVDYVRHHLSAWRAREFARVSQPIVGAERARMLGTGRRAGRFSGRRPSSAVRPGCARRHAPV